MTVIINAENLVAGRVAAFAAKQALLGFDVKIYNAEKAVITGKRKMVFDAWAHKNSTVGVWSKGPFHFKVPDRFLRRIVRGMIPYKTARGTAAFKRVLCYKGLPEGIVPNTEVPRSNVSKTTHDYVTIQEICHHIGGKA